MSGTISRRDVEFISVAIEEGLKSDVLMRHGCVAVMNGKIVSQGKNSSRNYSCDGFIHHCHACHAEIDALRNLWKLAGKKGKKFKEQECLL